MRKTSRKVRASVSPTKDANVTLPETLTALIVSEIKRLCGMHTDVKSVYLLKTLMTKFVSKDTDPADVRVQRAIEKWLAVEDTNYETDLRLLHTAEEFMLLPRVTWSAFVQYARSLVVQLLGETIPVEALLGGFSGGATTTRTRTFGHPSNKYLGKAEITADARKWFDLAMAESPLWTEFSNLLDIHEVPGNHMFTVPKSTTIDRVAAKEPDLNMYLQKGVGNFIRRRLRTVGINLNDQSINRRLAREGSITGRLATIDLSSASDSVSMGLGELLLPDLWFGLVSDLRSKQTRIPRGTGVYWHKNNMISSMGNGFTFELESLLFYVLARTTKFFTGGSGIVSVYGDDLIVGTDYVDEFIFVLSYFGFTVNTSKSYTSGPFRESCGGHYFDGSDISPFFIRRPIAKLRDAIILANQIRKWSEFPYGGILDPTLEPLWLLIKGHIPEEYWGGTNLESDSQLVSNDTPRKRLVAVSRDRDTGLGGYLFWHDTCEDLGEREGLAAFSERKVEQTFFRSRKVKSADRYLPCLFLHEIGV